MPATYLRVMAIALAIVLGGVAMINAIVDPYAIFGWIRIAGLNDPKARPDSDILQRKVFNAVTARPNALILGNSRAEIGIDPVHSAWQRRSLRAYNLAIPGGGLNSSLMALDTMCGAARYRLVLIGLDFQDFLIDADLPSVRDYVRRDLPSLRMRPTTLDLLRAAVTSGAAVDSLRTLQAQFERYPEIITSAGFNPLLDYVPMARQVGYYPLFQQRLQENARAYLRRPKSVYPASGGESPASDSLRQLIRKSSACSDEIVLFTYPYHSQLLLLFSEVGLWPAFEDWKRLLAATVQEENDNSRTNSHVRLLDFAYFSAAAQQPAPRPAQRTQESRWYWESGHFKKELGDEMLAIILAQEKPREGQGPIEAYELKGTTVEDWLDIVRTQNANFRRSHADELDIVRTTVALARKQ